MFRLDDRVALVTGASTGLGAAIAVALGDAGAKVACHGNTHSPDATCQRIKQAHPLTGDLSEPQTAKHLVEQTIDHFGRLDILINNAGIIRRAPAVEYSDDDWAAVLEVNLSSVFRLCQTAGKHMIDSERGEDRQYRVVTFISGGITAPAYAAAKGGVAQLTKALANEWARVSDQRKRDRAGLHAYR